MAQFKRVTVSTLPSIDPVTGRPIKRPASVYTVLLGVTVIILTIACVLLWFEWSRYDRQIKAVLSARESIPAARFIAAAQPIEAAISTVPATGTPVC